MVLVVSSNFKKEIQEDLEIERKYRIAHTQHEMEHRKELQDKVKHFQKSKSRVAMNGVRKTWKWLRKNYMNFQVKNTIENYEYAKQIWKNLINCLKKDILDMQN